MGLLMSTLKAMPMLPKQIMFMENMNRELIYSGAWGAGKTRAGNEKGYFLSARYPGNRGVILRKQFNHLVETTMDNFFRVVCPPSAIKHMDNQRHLCTLLNGSEILFLGIDQKSGGNSDTVASKIGSLEVGWIFADETIELEESEWDMLRGRLRLPGVPFRQIFGATNPGAPSHWIYRRAVLERDLTMISSSTLENTFLPQDYLDDLDKLPHDGLRYRRYVLGEWLGAEGLVYGDSFDAEKHIVEPFDIPATWERYRVIDFGYSNPFVCQWWTRPPKVSHSLEEKIPWFMYREIYMTQRTVEEHAKTINSFTENIQATIVDWDAEDRATLERHGIPTTKAYKEISPGIQEVTKQLLLDQMFFFKDCLVEEDSTLRKIGRPACTIEEFPNYAWIIRRGALQRLNEKEVPADKDNHGMDCNRYRAWYFSDVRRASADLRLGSSVRGASARSGWDVDGVGSSGRNWGGMLPDRNWRSVR